MQFFLGFDNDIQKCLTNDILDLLPESIEEKDITKIEVYLSDVCTASIYLNNGSSFEISSIVLENWRIIQSDHPIFRR